MNAVTLLAAKAQEALFSTSSKENPAAARLES